MCVTNRQELLSNHGNIDTSRRKGGLTMYDMFSYQAVLSVLSHTVSATRQVAEELSTIIPPASCSGFVSKAQQEGTRMSGELFAFDDKHFAHATYNCDIQANTDMNKAIVAVYRWSDFRSMHVEFSDFHGIQFDTKKVILTTSSGQSVIVSNSPPFYQPPDMVKQFYDDLRRLFLKQL
jgi:hypothetical protein